MNTQTNTAVATAQAAITATGRCPETAAAFGVIVSAGCEPLPASVGTCHTPETADIAFSDIADEVGGVYPRVMKDGDLDAGAWSCGMVAGLIHDIPKVGELVERINASGRAYLTQTKLNGRTVMRIGLGNILTTEQHLRKAWELIQAAAGEL